MKNPVFTGSAAAVVTPFTSGGIDFGKLEALLNFQINGGSDAVVVCGTTGEASTLPDKEHISVIKFAADKVNKRIPVIAGAGSNDTRHAAELSKAAEASGADAILSVTPYYNKTTQKGLYEHFRLIAASVKIPVILYNIPVRTNLNMNPETVKALSEIDNIAGLKECNLLQVGDLVNLCGDDFTIYSGDDNIILPVLSLGGRGVISTMANIIPKDTHDMVEKFLSGDTAGARKLQLGTLNLIKALFTEVNPIPIKAAMNLLGMNVGSCRLPLVDISLNNLELLKKELDAYGLKQISL
ncbi:4-hydroxy-tetrahydrodipicolinate synthase [Ruminiclostridium hungatei]|uniref:4-hydroxy-tetrahydrodipicolinate synthase n=1 Tax=Ruminiclostridium hungatei TaxID=48256 RepID=A0A1V4SMW7_RUMHU|nr:4-hydroxy-tetrahydrodipicolinate synthase [Ruminiclostridium hungatei]OPX45232.1 4-hydroxy-tetrahydrodipicolinate synthase [Ruminiclostridium hungatei]